MAVRIVAVGRLRAGPEKELFEHYAKRLPWPLEVHEIVEQQGRSGTDRRRREARLLAKALPREGRVVVLDIAVLELRDGTFDFVDNYGNTRAGRQRLFPSGTVLGGRWVPR